MRVFSLNDLLELQAKTALSASRILKNLKNTDLEGTFREEIVCNLIKPLLPMTCGLFHGTAISSISENSRRQEHDILLVDRECLPPFLYSERDGIFPIESILAKIEVKTTLNELGLEKSLKDADTFRSLIMNIEGYNTPNTESVSPGNNALQGIFAFQSNCKDEWARIKRILKDLQYWESPPIDFICVARNGLWAYLKNNLDNDERRWYFCKPKRKHHELLSFLALLLDTLPIIRQTRKNASFGKYVLCLRKNMMVLANSD